MTGRDFWIGATHSRIDVVQLLLSILQETAAGYCLIGGMAVNAYAEPVVSLDLDLVVVADQTEAVCKAAQEKGMKVEVFEHSINLSHPASDVRIQIQTDPRYQKFVDRAQEHEVLGYRLRVACLQDVLQGKLWAYLDENRRPSKRQKDRADILRLTEAHPELEAEVPANLLKQPP